MARSTIAEDIVRLEAELADVRNRISQQKAVREMEEGGGGNRFRTVFTPITELLQNESNLCSRLETLYAYQDRMA